MVYTYFTAMKNSRVVPLAYVIRKTPSISAIVIDREQEIIQNDPLQGNMFSYDTKKILAMIKEITVVTDDETWMIGPALSKRSNLVLWSAPVAQVHPRTADNF